MQKEKQRENVINKTEEFGTGIDQIFGKFFRIHYFSSFNIFRFFEFYLILIPFSPRQRAKLPGQNCN